MKRPFQKYIFKNDHDNVVLTMPLLAAGFYVWLGCVVAILGFIEELIVFRFSRRKIDRRKNAWK